MLVSTLIIGSGALFAIESRKIKHKRSETPMIQKKQQKQVRPLTLFTRKRRKLLQAFNKTNCQDFLVDIKGQKLQDLSPIYTQRQVSSAEKTNYQYLYISSTTLSLLTIGALVSQPLYLLGAIGTIYMGMPIIQEAFQSLFKDRRVKTSVIDSIFILGCIFTGHFLPSALGGWFYYLSRILLNKTEDHSKKSLINVFGEQPRFLWVVQDDTEMEIPFEELQIGDIVVVNAGETIPVDGFIVDGIATIDQHMLTGEFQPSEKGIGSQVFASTILLSGRIYIQVDKAGKDTAAAQIGEILNRNSDFKMSIEARGEAITDGTAFPTLLFSGFTLAVLGPPGALVVLNSHFGYNMRIIGPIGMLSFLNLASQSGILIKDGRSLDLLYQVDTVVFDKTGTLTQEQPLIGHIYTSTGYTENDILKYAASAEYKQIYPIALAILQESRSRDLVIPKIDEAEYKIGYGITVEINAQTIRVGSHRFMEMENIPISQQILDHMTRAHSQGHSLVMVAVDNHLAGALELHAAIRPEAKLIIDQLRQRNIQMYVISGDDEIPTKRLVEELGIDHFYANTLPEDKAYLIKELQDSGKFVCYVGDGINDSIALKQANVSVSLRGASTIATDTAYIILMDESLRQLPQAFDISDRYNHCMKTSFSMTILPSILAIGGAFLLGSGATTSVMLKWFGLFGGASNAIIPVAKHARDTSSSSAQPHSQ